MNALCPPIVRQTTYTGRSPDAIRAQHMRSAHRNRIKQDNMARAKQRARLRAAASQVKSSHVIHPSVLEVPAEQQVVREEERFHLKPRLPLFLPHPTISPQLVLQTMTETPRVHNTALPAASLPRKSHRAAGRPKTAPPRRHINGTSKAGVYHGAMYPSGTTCHFQLGELPGARLRLTALCSEHAICDVVSTMMRKTSPGGRESWKNQKMGGGQKLLAAQQRPASARSRNILKARRERQERTKYQFTRTQPQSAKELLSKGAISLESLGSDMQAVKRALRVAASRGLPSRPG